MGFEGQTVLSDVEEARHTPREAPGGVLPGRGAYRQPAALAVGAENLHFVGILTADGAPSKQSRMANSGLWREEIRRRFPQQFVRLHSENLTAGGVHEDEATLFAQDRDTLGQVLHQVGVDVLGLPQRLPSHLTLKSVPCEY